MHVYSSTPTGILNKWKVRTERLSLVFLICVIPQRLVSNNTRVSSRSRKQQRKYNCGGRITIILARPNDNRTHGCGLTLLHDSVAALLIGRLGVFFFKRTYRITNEFVSLCLVTVYKAFDFHKRTHKYFAYLLYFAIPFHFLLLFAKMCDLLSAGCCRRQNSMTAIILSMNFAISSWCKLQRNEMRMTHGRATLTYHIIYMSWTVGFFVKRKNAKVVSKQISRSHLLFQNT